jgi:small subunit ribosomal protein S19e
MGMYEEDPKKIIENVAKELEPLIKAPEWAPYVKTGMHKERPPANKEWFYKRAASILRAVAMKGPIGVAKLRVKYGGRKNNGVASAHFCKGSGNIIRKALKELDKVGLTIYTEKGVHKGRIVTAKGTSMLAKAGFVQRKKE